MEKKDTYKTLSKPSDEILFKEKKSKFFGYAFPIDSEDDVKAIIGTLRKKHHTANHVCYAWQLGKNRIRYRANDDGEPNNSAGLPIYGQIQSYGLTNVLVAVVRIFGGTKLGVGGLISAYRTTAQLALKSADIVEKTIEAQLSIDFGYAEMNKVMRLIKQHRLHIVSQHLEIACKIVVRLPLGKVPQIVEILQTIKNVKVLELGVSKSNPIDFP